MSKRAFRGIIAFFLVVVFAAAVWFTGYKITGIRDVRKWFNGNEQTEGENGGGLIVTPDENDGIITLSAEVSTFSANTYTVTAKVLPEDATFKTVKFTATWKNAASSWALGKAVNDYVEITTSNYSATVTCNEAFGEQIILTAIADNYVAVSASCTLDYLKAVTKFTVTKADEKIVVRNAPYGGGNYFTISDIEYGVGTVQGELSKNNFTVELDYGPYATMKDSNEFTTACDSNEFKNKTLKVLERFTVANTSGYVYPTSFITVDGVTLCGNDTSGDVGKFSNSYLNKVVALAHNRPCYVYINANYTYGGIALDCVSERLTLTFDCSQFVSAATDVTLDQDSLVFGG